MSVKVWADSIRLFVDEKGAVCGCETADGHKIPINGATVFAANGKHQSATLEVSVAVLPVSESRTLSKK